MLAAASQRRCYLLHKWSSLACTLFLLILCVTGLPLVFKDELEGLLAVSKAAPARPGARAASLDVLVDSVRGPQGLYPGQAVRWISLEDDRSEIWIALAPRYEAPRKLDHVVRLDAYTGRVLERQQAAAAAAATVLDAVFWVHKGLLAGTPGEWFLAAMGLAFVLATASGAVLYAPFMRKLAFGSVRHERGPRLRWLDLHNLLGIATLAWALVVGATGVLNELSDPLYARWRESALGEMLKPYAGRPMPAKLAPVQAAVDRVLQAMPGMKIRSVRYPDGELGSPHHYLVWAIGDSPVRSRLFQPALVDAATGELSGVGQVPWYLLVVQLARPLHFGDYGGWPLKLVWAALDVALIGILASGIYLWLARRKAEAARRGRLPAQRPTACAE